MALTAHELIHINAMLSEIAETRLLSRAEQDILANAKGINRNRYSRFMDKLEAGLLQIIANDQFPSITIDGRTVIDDPAALHSFLEEYSADIRQ